MPTEPQDRYRRTKIVCTLGPASNSPEDLRSLISAGMDVARLNFSHGDHEEHEGRMDALRALSDETGKQVAILQDLQGPKIRVGKLPPDGMSIEPERPVWLVPAEESAGDVLPVTYAHLLEDVSEGDRILLADGTIELTVEAKEGGALRCRALSGGTITSHKGVNLPSSVLRVGAFTPKDEEDLRFGLQKQVDIVALSFVRHERDLEPVRAMIEESDHKPLLMAKIERPEALRHLEGILDTVDGIMVARGDLGVEMPFAEVPMIQKRLIEAARKAAKPVITATQMLRSMVDSPRPTRAEAADVANAILDGTDAVMLSEETAVGHYPAEAVQVLDGIARATEPHVAGEMFARMSVTEQLPVTEASVSRSASLLARDCNAAAIVAFTTSGSTARFVARTRPEHTVVALTSSVHTQRQLAVSWGVYPVHVDLFEHTDQMFSAARSVLLERGLARKGQRFVLTAGVPLQVRGNTNLLRVIEI